MSDSSQPNVGDLMRINTKGRVVLWTEPRVAFRGVVATFDRGELHNALVVGIDDAPPQTWVKVITSRGIGWLRAHAVVS